MRKAFTLIEMLIVMAMVSILIAIIIPSYRGMQNDAWLAKAAKETQTVQVAIESYYRHHNKFPAQLEDLPKASPAILTALPNDPWNTNELSDSYGYIHATLAGFGEYYIVYTRSLDGQDDILDRSNIVDGTLHLPADSDDIVFSNLAIKKDL